MSVKPDQEWEAGIAARAASSDLAERQAAFTEVFGRYRDQVQELAAGLTSDSALAEDVVQEVFVAVLRGLRHYRAEARLSTWLYRITIRTAARARACRPVAHVPLSHDIPAPSTPNPAIAGEQRREIQAALAALPAAHRMVLVLFALQGLSHHEIADILGVPTGTVWSRLHTARRLLASSLSIPRP